MKKGIDLRMYGKGVTIVDCIRKSRGFGFEGIEVSLFPNTEGLIELDGNEIEKILFAAKENNIEITSLAASAALWDSPPTSLNSENRNRASKFYF